MLDKGNEILDYETSKPNFEKWSQDISNATGGKSLGNVRAMHGKTAAGKLTSIYFNDAEKAIEVVAKVVDDNEWNKVLEGVYTGFSVGGKYAKRWADSDLPGVMRYTADPSELSLVDNPCIPGATFSLIKADGQEVECPFTTVEDTPMTKTVKGDYGTDEEAGYADPGYQEDDKPRYPLKEDGKWSEERIRAAWGFIHHKQSEEVYTRKEIREIEKRIIAAWKEEIDPAGPPADKEGAKEKGSGDNHEKTVPASTLGVSTVPDSIDPVLKKGMYDVAQLAVLLQELSQIQASAEWESKIEGDKSRIPAKLKASVKQLTTVLRGMLDEETAELIGDPETPNPDALMQAAKSLLAKRAAADKAVQDKLVSLHKTIGEMIGEPAVEKNTGNSQGATVDTSSLEKAISDAFEKMAKRITALENQPAAPVGALNTLGKSADVTSVPSTPTVPLVKDHYGQEHATASLIKSAHLSGGRPLTAG